MHGISLPLLSSSSFLNVCLRACEDKLEGDGGRSPGCCEVGARVVVTTLVEANLLEAESRAFFHRVDEHRAG